MNQQDAIALLRGASIDPGGVWADLGSGAGTFTRALSSLLGPNGTVYAVDRDERALRALERLVLTQRRGAAAIHAVEGDFTRLLALPPLDGALLANSLHFVPYPHQADVLGRVANAVAPGGAIIVIEYDRRRASPWVPYPISPAALGDVAQQAGLGRPALLATKPSEFSGTIYSAIVRREASRRVPG